MKWLKIPYRNVFKESLVTLHKQFSNLLGKEIDILDFILLLKSVVSF